MSLKKSLHLIAVAALCLGSFPGLALAGSLNPPGAPAGTMVTLDDINTAIGTADASAQEAQDPRTPIEVLPFDIDGPGSYYLSGDLTATAAAAGITVDASDVDIDLNGFALIGDGVGTDGIAAASATPAHSHITSHGGTIRDWVEEGIALGDNAHITVDGVRVLSNGGNGAEIGDHSLVKCSTISESGEVGLAGGARIFITNTEISGNFNTGVSISGESVISSCIITGNGVGTDGAGANVSGGGLVVGSGSVIERSTISSNMGAYGLFHGFGLFTVASTIRGCSINGNATAGIFGGIHIVDNVVYNNGDIAGIVTGGAVITGNTCSENTGNGIQASNSVVTGNTCVNNSVSGIGVTGSGNCLVDGNLCTGNDVGIDASTGENLVVRNLCLDSTTSDYDAGDGTALPQNPGTNFTNAIIGHPWANFEN